MKDIFIHIVHNSLDDIICNNIINKFNNESNIKQGSTINGVDLVIKNSFDFYLSNNIHWSDINQYLLNLLRKEIDNYFKILNLEIFNINRIDNTGFMIMKYIKNEGFYDYHNDFYISDKNHRIFTYIWYLNTIEIGGETEIMDKELIKPESGKLLIFPTCWTYPHRGLMPISNDKYIVTGWIMTKV